MWCVPDLTHLLRACLAPLNPPYVSSLVARFKVKLPEEQKASLCLIRLPQIPSRPQRRAARAGSVVLGRARLASSPPARPARAQRWARSLGTARGARRGGPAKDGAFAAQRTQILKKIGFTAHQKIFLTEHLEIKLISWVDVSQSKPHIWQIYSSL